MICPDVEVPYNVEQYWWKNRMQKDFGEDGYDRSSGNFVFFFASCFWLKFILRSSLKCSKLLNQVTTLCNNSSYEKWKTYDFSLSATPLSLLWLQTGKTKVFLRAGQMADLDARRALILSTAAKTIQRKIRTYIARKYFIALHSAAVSMQSICRGSPDTVLSVFPYFTQSLSVEKL